MQDRFAHLPRGGINYAYHMDASLYARFLRSFSGNHGVQRVEGKIVNVRTDPDSGYITALDLADGSSIGADFFIDCTGFRALLIHKALNVGYEDWSHWLLNDSALATQTTAVRDAVPYTRAIAGPAGWQWRIPLQHRVGNGIVYASRYISDDEARHEFLGSLEGEVIKEPWPIRFRPGRRLKCWHKNCVALGLAGSFIEPLESTTIHLIQRGITHLLQLFPQVVSQPDIEQYNATMESELVHVRDFVLMHYVLTNRRDTPYWRTIADMEWPDTLRHRVELFRESGRVFRVPNELFGENSWIQVMMGQGVMPRQYHPTADVMSRDDLSRFLDEIRSHVGATADRLPAHMDYIRNYAPAVRP